MHLQGWYDSRSACDGGVLKRFLTAHCSPMWITCFVIKQSGQHFVLFSGVILANKAALMNSCLRRTNLRTSKNISTKKRAPSLITEIMMREKTAECNLCSPQTAAELQMLHALSIKPKASEKLFIQSSLDPSTVSSSLTTKPTECRRR